MNTTTSPAEIRSLITTMATVTRHPATEPLSRARAIAEAAPFADLKADLDRYFDSLADAPLDDPDAVAQMLRICAGHLWQAQARLAGPTPVIDWSDHLALGRLVHTAAHHAADLRFTAVLTDAGVRAGRA